MGSVPIHYSGMDVKNVVFDVGGVLLEWNPSAVIARLHPDPVIQGKVRQLMPAPGMPVPHLGWSRLTVRDDSIGLRNGDYVYFAHSFACDDGPASVATADYGRTIPAAVRQGNYSGMQFHPERSGEAGARALQSFLDS